MKTCPKCKEVKQESDFYKNKSRYDGLGVNCKYCQSSYTGVVKPRGYEYVYVITNPAWDGYVKIGKSVDVEARLNSFQTSCPFRDYKLHYKTKCKDTRIVENWFSVTYDPSVGEWYKVEIKEAIELIKELKKNFKL